MKLVTDQDLSFSFQNVCRIACKDCSFSLSCFDLNTLCGLALFLFHIHMAVERPLCTGRVSMPYALPQLNGETSELRGKLRAKTSGGQARQA